MKCQCQMWEENLKWQENTQIHRDLKLEGFDQTGMKGKETTKPSQMLMVCRIFVFPEYKICQKSISILSRISN